MSESKKNPNHTPIHDALGVGLVILGALLGVSAVMFIKQPDITNPGAFTAAGSALVRAFGPPAILWLTVGLVFVGGRLFVFGAERGSLRDPIGFVATALGLSIFMGAFNPDSIALGGHWGQFIGGRTSEIATRAGGILLGFAAILIPAWVIWLRSAPPALLAKVGAVAGEAPASETASAPSAARAARPATPARKATEDPSGVTTAEADALLPDPEREEILAALRSANRKSASTANHAPSPYPADVRREGGIPAGARPIETSHEHSRPAPQAEPRAAAVVRPVASPAPAIEGGAGSAGAVHGWTSTVPGASEVGAGADLARGKDARGAGAAARPPSSAGLSAPAPRAAASAEVLREPPRGAAPASLSATPIPLSSGPVGMPSWEVDEELADEGEPEEPEVARPAEELSVDAYGTPLELVAALRGEAPARAPLAESTEDEADDADEVDEDELDEDELDEDELDEDEAEPVGSVEPFVAREDVDAEDEVDADEERELVVDLEEDRDEAALAETAAEELEAELDADLEEAETPDADLGPEREPEQAASDEPPAPTASSDEEAPPEPEEEREVVLQPVQNSLFDAPQAPAIAPVPELAKAAARSSPEVARPPAKVAPEAAKPAAKTTPEVAKPAAKLVPEVAKAAAKSATEVAKPAAKPATELAKPAARPAPDVAKPAARSAARERTVVVEPQAAPSARSEPAASGDDLVFRCGMLFLKEKRVAVSMLQREFGLDFKQATAVLDQLQQQGLIGPYLGGQRRDILLTAEEWRAKVGAAS